MHAIGYRHCTCPFPLMKEGIQCLFLNRSQKPRFAARRWVNMQRPLLSQNSWNVDILYSYHLVIEDNDCHFWRIQCKSGRYRAGAIIFDTSLVMNEYRRNWERRSYRGEV